MKETLSTKFMRQGACLGKDPDLFVHDEFDNNKNNGASLLKYVWKLDRAISGVPVPNL